MTEQTTTPIAFFHFGQVQAHLGGIPAYRILVNPSPGCATEEDAIALDRKYNWHCELIDGILVQKVHSLQDALLVSSLLYYLVGFVDEPDLGVVLDSGGMLRLFPNQIRVPDVSFTSWNSMPDRECPNEPVWSLAPDLAVEILNEGNTEEEMNRKLKEYFQAGSKLVWYVDPPTRTVRVYTSPRKSVLLTENDTLDGGTVLPGFSLPIKKWFQRASRRLRK